MLGPGRVGDDLEVKDEHSKQGLAVFDSPSSLKNDAALKKFRQFLIPPADPLAGTGDRIDSLVRRSCIYS